MIIDTNAVPTEFKPTDLTWREAEAIHCYHLSRRMNDATLTQQERNQAADEYDLAAAIVFGGMAKTSDLVCDIPGATHGN